MIFDMKLCAIAYGVYVWANKTDAYLNSKAAHAAHIHEHGGHH
jgi:hypothetical protein